MSIDWRAEAELEPTLQYRRSPPNAAASARAVLLTGATGFLGAHILNDLLASTSAEIYCLVRRDGKTSGDQRLRSHLEQLGLFRPELFRRVKQVPGELGPACLGLTSADYLSLANEIDTIYHAGGLISAVQPYSVLRYPNVLGTHELLKFSAQGCPKALHFISTMSVFFSHQFLALGRVSESDVPVLDAGITSSYIQSKLTAERLIFESQSRGLEATIYRVIRISGHSQTGVVPQGHGDLLISLLRGCIRLGSYPLWNIDIPMVPVDYVSRAISYISQHPDRRNRVFHFIDPQPVSWQELMQVLCTYGYPLHALEPDHWYQELKRTAAKNPKEEALRRLWILLNSANNLFVKKPAYEDCNVARALQGTDIERPLISRTILERYISFFQAKGYLNVYDDPRMPAQAQTSDS